MAALTQATDFFNFFMICSIIVGLAKAIDLNFKIIDKYNVVRENVPRNLFFRNKNDAKKQYNWKQTLIAGCVGILCFMAYLQTVQASAQGHINDLLMCLMAVNIISMTLSVAYWRNNSSKSVKKKILVIMFRHMSLFIVFVIFCHMHSMWCVVNPGQLNNFCETTELLTKNLKENNIR